VLEKHPGACVEDRMLVIGAGVTFQDLVDSPQVPAQLRAAALTMANRNTRNRATVGGNLGANKSCASLIPLLLACGATIRMITKQAARPVEIPLANWLAAPVPYSIVLEVRMPMIANLLAASLRASRTACDLATATVAVTFRIQAGTLRGLRIAMGGFGSVARVWPELSSLFEGQPLAPKADIERLAGPLLSAISDQRGSAAFKRLRGASLLADAMHGAEVLA
jgi:CO/xanthine dehydrogenase FAD-binding subunit